MQRSKVKFTRGHRQTWRPDGDIILDLLGSSSFSSFSELVDSDDRLGGLTEASFWTSLSPVAFLVALSWWIVMTDLEAWWRHHSGPP